MTLQAFFTENKRVALGFSGGVDSSYLLYAGLNYGADIRPYCIKTAFQPQFEYDDAMRLAHELHVEVSVLEFDILPIQNVAENPENRCYYCKTALFSALKEKAIADGYSVLIDGTNFSDDADDRPGMRALSELKVRSPLRECGITKAEVRRLSKEAGLFTWNKPAYACLATRIPTGDMITANQLKCVEGAEDALFALGYTDFRVRVFHGAARLQFNKEQMLKAANEAATIIESIKPFFGAVLLDLAGR